MTYRKTGGYRFACSSDLARCNMNFAAAYQYCGEGGNDTTLACAFALWGRGLRYILQLTFPPGPKAFCHPDHARNQERKLNQ